MAGLKPTAKRQNQKTLRQKPIYLEHTVAVFKASIFLECVTSLIELIHAKGAKVQLSSLNKAKNNALQLFIAAKP